MKNPDAFDMAFSALCELYDKRDVSAAFCAMYRKALVGALGLQGAVRAIEAAFSSKNYGFPKPGDLIEKIKGNGETEALLAWEQMQEGVRMAGAYRSVLFSDGKIPVIVQDFGGWQRICSWTVREMDDRRNEFLRAHKALPPTEPKVISGSHDTYNNSRGYLEHVQQPICIGNIEHAKALPEPNPTGPGAGAARKAIEKLQDDLTVH